MIINYDFGVRSVPPCFDCDERGHCTMNCSPRERNRPIMIKGIVVFCFEMFNATTDPGIVWC